MSDDPVDRTIAAYDAAADRYRDAATQPGASWGAFIDAFAEQIPGGHVLEVGSGPGLEAAALERRGLVVTRSDAAAAFVAMMVADGHEARLLDVRVDDLGGPYDGVFANAVLLHLDRAELVPVLRRLRAAVRRGGALAVTVKEGDGEEWHDRKLGLPRRFTYWRRPALLTALADASWDVHSCEHVDGTREPVEAWLFALATAG